MNWVRSSMQIDTYEYVRLVRADLVAPAPLIEVSGTPVQQT